MGKFTKGPWEAGGRLTLHGGDQYFIYCDDVTGSAVATVDLRYVSRPPEEKLANANLIAAAGTAATQCEEIGYDGQACIEALPELVNALEMVRDADDDRKSDGLIQMPTVARMTIGRALSKAKGQQ